MSFFKYMKQEFILDFITYTQIAELYAFVYVPIAVFQS